MFGNPSQKKVKPANVELFQSTLVNEVWLSWLRWVISFCGPPVSESFENKDAYAWVCIGLFKPSFQRAQLFVPSGSGPLIWASKKMLNVFNGSLDHRKDNTAVRADDATITRNGCTYPRRTTKGWQLCMESCPC